MTRLVILLLLAMLVPYSLQQTETETPALTVQDIESDLKPLIELWNSKSAAAIGAYKDYAIKYMSIFDTLDHNTIAMTKEVKKAIEKFKIDVADLRELSCGTGNIGCEIKLLTQIGGSFYHVFTKLQASDVRKVQKMMPRTEYNEAFKDNGLMDLINLKIEICLKTVELKEMKDAVNVVEFRNEHLELVEIFNACHEFEKMMK